MFKSILLPIDLGHESSWDKAAPVAIAMAKHEKAKIHLMTVIPDFGMAVVGSFFPADYGERAVKETKVALEKFAAEHLPADQLGDVTVVSGTIYKRIIRNADKLGCDIIVMSSHRPEKADYLLGPNAARVVRHANQSVFIVR